MSISSLGTLAAVRDEKKPKRSDLGKEKAEDTTEDAKLRDTITAAIPTELIGPYTFLLAAIVGLINEETKAHYPDQFRTLRWWLFGIFFVFTLAFAYFSAQSKRKADAKGFPALEVATAAVAFTVWGLSLPESPLVPSLNGDNKTLGPLIVLVVGGVFFVAMSNGLKSPRKKRGT